MKKISTVTTEAYELNPSELGRLLIFKENGVVNHIHALGFFFTVEQFKSFSTDLQNILQDIEMNQEEPGSEKNCWDDYL